MRASRDARRARDVSRRCGARPSHAWQWFSVTARRPNRPPSCAMKASARSVAPSSFAGRFHHTRIADTCSDRPASQARCLADRCRLQSPLHPPARRPLAHRSDCRKNAHRAPAAARWRVRGERFRAGATPPDVARRCFWRIVHLVLQAGALRQQARLFSCRMHSRHSLVGYQRPRPRRRCREGRRGRRCCSASPSWVYADLRPFRLTRSA